MFNLQRLTLRLITCFLILTLSCITGCGGGNTSASNSTSSTSLSSSSSSSSSSANSVVTEETLPRIDIFNINGQIQDEPKVTANMKVTTYTVGELPTVDYDGYIGVEYRGSSSQFFYDKKNFGIETRDSDGADLDVSLLGFPEEEDWVLHGPFGDKSLIRNTLMFDIGQTFDRYASRYRYVEVYLNEEYEGLYVLLEKIKRDSHRVDINKLKDDENEGEDVTGGYIIKLDKTNGEHPEDPAAYALFTPNMSFISNHGAVLNPNSNHYFIYNYPKPDAITVEQKAYIQTYVHNFENALLGSDFKDSELGYQHFIDVDSFVDYFIATEISGNVDGFRLSTYLVKDKNEKLAMGPLWDYNLAFGNADYNDASATNLWIHRSEERTAGGVFGIPFWWYRLLEDASFATKVKNRWESLRNTTLSDSEVMNKINTKVDYLKVTGAADRNFVRWDILGIYVWPNAYIGQTYDDEVNYLKTWLENRLAWLDAEIPKL